MKIYIYIYLDDETIWVKKEKRKPTNVMQFWIERDVTIHEHKHDFL